MKIDLHSHTNASDGEFSAEELVDIAVRSGLKAIAITDHDSVNSCEKAVEYAKDKDIEIIPGIEISCIEEEKSFDEVHVLGLFVDFNNPTLVEFCKSRKESRIRQKKRIIGRLQQLGFDITFEEVARTVEDSFARPHIAAVLLKKYPEEFDSVWDVFDKYLEKGKPAYVKPKNKISIKTAIDVIKKANGVAFLAHPATYNDEDTAELIDFFVNLGGEGIETAYPYDKNRVGVPKEESDRKNQFLKKIANNKGLLETGGTDFHGSIRKVSLGETGISFEDFQKLKQYIKEKKK
ncbi:MAG: PHP domain-containing protein [Nanoarchaeota archaeon]|nr:PHP domain-containing protein [Nanoarchaeota archaeon]